jgi:hypothetical protein
MSVLDDIVAGLLAFGGVVAVVTICFWDSREAPNPVTLAEAFEGEPGYIAALATASVLTAVKENVRPLQVKMIMARVALGIILIAATLGIFLKVVESKNNGRNEGQGVGDCLSSRVHKPPGEQSTGRFRIP